MCIDLERCCSMFLLLSRVLRQGSALFLVTCKPMLRLTLFRAVPYYATLGTTLTVLTGKSFTTTSTNWSIPPLSFVWPSIRPGTDTAIVSRRVEQVACLNQALIPTRWDFETTNAPLHSRGPGRKDALFRCPLTRGMLVAVVYLSCQKSPCCNWVGERHQIRVNTILHGYAAFPNSNHMFILCRAYNISKKYPARSLALRVRHRSESHGDSQDPVLIASDTPLFAFGIFHQKLRQTLAFLLL